MELVEIYSRIAIRNMSNVEPREAIGTTPPRRIVTGHDKNNVARVIWDSRARQKEGSPGSGTVISQIWCTDETPADISVGENIEDAVTKITGTPPPENGTRMGVIDFLPGNRVNKHRTETLDYAIVLSGEIDMELDDSTVHLKAGDIVVQRGTYHAWLNRGTKPARIAFVLIDAKPLGIGKPVPRGVPASQVHDHK